MKVWRGLIHNPWRPPWFLVVITWSYIVWAIAPVLVAVAFSFNAGRSISVWQGFDLTRWYVGDPQSSVLHSESLLGLLFQTLELAGWDMLIAVPLGTLLALGVTRWRGYGARPVNFLMLLPLAIPELVLGVSIYLAFQYIYLPIELSTLAQVLGQVTFMTPFVVIVVRGRLLSLGGEYEEAAADLGANPRQTLQLVLLPLMLPAIFASMMVVFALAMDNFVIAQWLSCGHDCATISIQIYTAVRNAPLPSLNALASIMIFLSLVALTLAYLGYRFLTRGEKSGGISGLMN